MPKHLIANEQVVDPASGEVLARKGERDPERLLEYLSWYSEPGEPMPDWLRRAYDACTTLY